MALKTLADFARQAQSQRTKSNPETQRRVLLLAEDDEDSYLLFKLAWECAEIPVPIWRVGDGEEAIRYLKESAGSQDSANHPMPCLVVLDIKMPKRDGFEVLSWIRADQRFRDVPTIILSASGEQVDRASAGKLGADDYFVKPVSFPELVEIVRGMHERWVLNAGKERGQLGASPDSADRRSLPRRNE